MNSLFGTDGIRGIAYEPPLDRRTVSRIGEALARKLGPASPRVVLGRDTRKSGPDIERWLMEGLARGGAKAESAGVVTTPAVAFLTRTEGFDAGIVISASHNPYRDNGIKIFCAGGSKSGAELETAIERDLPSLASPGEATEDASAIPDPDPRFEELYLDHLLATLEPSIRLPKLEIVLDCANGAAYRVGPRLLRELGLLVHPLCAEPDGENINRECGSTFIDTLRAQVVEKGCALGAALDGDGDRLLMVDSRGRVLDGDGLLLVFARRFRKEGRQGSSVVVATVMSNMALEKALSEEGIRLHRTPVGDKFVAREMAERRVILGGEQSGHIIFSEHGYTGDGLLTLVQLLRVMALEGRSLEELGILIPFPQVLRNVRVKERRELHAVPEIAEAVRHAEEGLRGRGRVLVRYSGTEPLLRIMMEGPDREELEAFTTRVERAVRISIGENG